MMNSQLYKDLLTDIWTFYLTFSGIMISIMTLLYSFIMNKRAELELHADQLKKGNNDPIMKRRQNLAIKYIKKLKKVNNWCFIVFCMSVFSYLISWACLRFLPTSYYTIILYIIGILSFIIVIGSILLFYRIVIQYKNDTKI